MDVGIVTAVVTAGVSLIVSIITAVVAYIAKVRGDTRMAELQERLTAERETRNAQRDYEYDARKRLYTELQPVLFQLADRSARALDRIHETFAESSRDGSILWPGRLGSGWEDDSYHMVATVWDLVAPLAFVRCIQRKLTTVDLSVDPTIRWQFSLARELHTAWTAAGDLAREAPRVEYDGEERESRQHVLSGHLEQAVDLLLQGDDGAERDTPISYSAFRSRFFDPDFYDAFSHFSLAFTDMLPAAKPVLWRILLVQAHIHAALIQTFNSFATGKLRQVHPAEALSDHQLLRYDWRPEELRIEVGPDPDVAAVRAYLRTRFPQNPSGLTG